MSTVQLRDYQERGLADIRAAWASGAQNVLYVLPPGGGKTVIFASELLGHKGAACAIAHRRELIGQMSTTLARLGVRHRVIAPGSVIREIVALHVMATGCSYHEPTAPVGVASVDSLVRRELGSWADQVSLWVTDECFPAGTLVDGRPIESLRIGDLVTAFDETTGWFEKRAVVRLFRNPAPREMVAVGIGLRRFLYCTPGHPFWTRRGWVDAVDLALRDEVLAYDGADGRWVGVSSVSLFLPGQTGYPGLGPDDGFVYNIEVEGLHTYVAGGVTVHNCHHLLRANKWGKALAMFPNARGLGVSGTPERADGKGLGRHADGVFDTMVVGPYGRELIDQGFLTDYRIYAPESDLHRENLPISETTGEFAPKALVEATRSSHITGDMVEQYLKIAPGKLGVTFTISVDLAVETAARYREAGVPAEAVSAETPELVRASILRRFAKREIMQLVNVDLFGEGFDLPAIEVVSDGAATQSYAKYAQRFGRMGRPMTGKERGLFIDHVGNVVHHATRRGLPDSYQTWTLDRREKRSRATDGPSPVRSCPACSAVFERIYRQCPYCGHIATPAQRSAPEYVDGDLLELDPAVLARLRASAEALRATPAVPYGATPEIRGAIMKRHRDLTATQDFLCNQIALWAGWQQHLGRDDHESYRRFYREFGVDVATAQTLRIGGARELSERIEKALASAGVRRKGEAA